MESSDEAKIGKGATEEPIAKRALEIVLNHDEKKQLLYLRKENEKLRDCLDAASTLATEHQDWYKQLCWAAKTSPSDPLKWPYLEEWLATLDENLGKEKAAKMRDEYAQLKAEGTGDWNQGFNAGMLAASRLYGAYTRAIDTLVHKEDETGEDGDFKETPEQQRREAQGEFPDLNIDT